MAGPPIIVVEDDPFTRLIPIVLDPNSPDAHQAAFADFMAHDEPDFGGWIERVRDRSPGLYPAEIRMVTTQEEMRAALRDACGQPLRRVPVRPDDIVGLKPGGHDG